MTAEATTAARRGPPGLWKHRDFNLLWAGETVSEVGTAMTTLALPTLAVLRFGADPLAVGILMACTRLPFPVLALPVGALVDRVPRRRLAVAADAGLALTVGSIPVLNALNLLHLWTLDVIALAVGAFSVVFDIALLALIPALVGDRLLPTAMARFEVTFATASLAGPGLGGLLIQVWGAARTIVADAASYAVSLACLLLLRAGDARPEPPEHTSVRRGMADGLRFVFGHPVLRSLVLLMALEIVGGHAVEGLEVLFSYRSLHLTPGQLGVALTVDGVGAFVGALVLGRIARRIGPGPAIALSGAVVGGAQVAYVAALRLPPLAVLIPAFAVVGAFGAAQNMTQVTLRTLLTRDHLRGRMNAIFRTVYWGAWPLGNLVGGAVASVFGTAQTIIGSGVLALAASLAMLGTPVGRMRRMPDGGSGGGAL